MQDDSNTFIGEGYCSFASRETDEEKPCQIYSQILTEFKSSRIKELPCPPPFCTEFQNIKQCNNPVGVCQEDGPQPFLGQVFGSPRPGQGFGPPLGGQCVHKVRDLFCKQIKNSDGTGELEEKDCFDPTKFGPGWVAETATNGKKYCVPSRFPGGFSQKT